MTSARQPESAAALHGRQPLSLPTLPNLGLEVQGVRLWSHHRVTVPRSNGSRYETSFFACSGCSVMFLNDATFNAWHAITPEAETAVIVTPARRWQ